jgi:hypothetical protein
MISHFLVIATIGFSLPLAAQAPTSEPPRPAPTTDAGEGAAGAENSRQRGGWAIGGKASTGDRKPEANGPGKTRERAGWALGG